MQPVRNSLTEPDQTSTAPEVDNRVEEITRVDMTRVSQQSQESIIAPELNAVTPSEATKEKEDILAFLKKYMEFRIQGVDNILNDKKNQNPKEDIRAFLEDKNKIFDLNLVDGGGLDIPISERQKCEQLFEKKAPGFFDVVRNDLKQRKETIAKHREDQKGVTVDEKIIKELSNIMIHKCQIKYLLSAGGDEAVVDKAVVHKVKIFSEAFKGYWKNYAGKPTGSDIEKDVEEIKKMFTERVSSQKEVSSLEQAVLEHLKKSTIETPSATPRTLGCFSFFSRNSVDTDRSANNR